MSTTNNPITTKSRRLSRGLSNAIVPLTKKKSKQDLTGKMLSSGDGITSPKGTPPPKGNAIKHKMAKDYERLKDLNSEVVEIIKYVQKYQAAIAEVAVTGERIANIMMRVGESLPENEHANALKTLGEKQASIETLRKNWESNLGNFVNTMRQQQENDRVRIGLLEKEMDKANKVYEYQIKKMAEQTTKARKQGGDQMVKSMENLTEMVQEVDDKRGQMSLEVEHAIISEYCQWFSSWCLVMTTEGEFFRRSHELVQESAHLFPLAAQAPPPPPATNWRADICLLSPRGSPRKSPRKRKEKDQLGSSSMSSPRWHHTDGLYSASESDDNNGGSSSTDGGSGKEEKVETPGRRKKKMEKKKKKKKKKDQLEEFKLRVEMDKASMLKESMMMKKEGKRRKKMKVNKVIALYDYQPEGEDELAFKVGDIIHLIQREGGGWWEGRIGDMRGYFPVNYVKEIYEHQSEDESDDNNKVSLSTDGDSDSDSESDSDSTNSFQSIGSKEGKEHCFFSSPEDILDRKRQAHALLQMSANPELIEAVFSLSASQSLSGELRRLHSSPTSLRDSNDSHPRVYNGKDPT